MKKTDAVKRWNDESFAARAKSVLQRLLLTKEKGSAVDMRGVAIGLEGVPSGFEFADFQDVILEDGDATFARFSCSFSRAKITNSRFVEASFDTCRFKDARFIGCDFSGARMDSPTLDDTSFETCNFLNARLGGRGSNEYGGKRTVFRECDFSNATFQNLQLRAVSFQHCRFDHALFKKCYLAGVKFEGETIGKEIFHGCHIHSLTMNGNPFGN